jgi:hypothetical protein
MKNLMSANGEFSGIDEKLRNKLIVEFTEVIKNTRLSGFGVAVDAKYWNKLPRSFQKKHGNAQEFCFERILRRIRDHLNIVGNQDYVSITFDHDMDLSKPRLTRFDHVLKCDEWARERFASICFANSRAYLPLQAADMLAWETRRHLETLNNNAKPTFGSVSLFSPGALKFAAGEYWNEAEFTKYVDVRTGTLKHLADDASP